MASQGAKLELTPAEMKWLLEESDRKLGRKLREAVDVRNETEKKLTEAPQILSCEIEAKVVMDEQVKMLLNLTIQSDHVKRLLEKTFLVEKQRDDLLQANKRLKSTIATLKRDPAFPSYE